MGSQQTHQDLEIIPIHATLPVETVRCQPLPVLPPMPNGNFKTSKKKQQRQQQLADFCSIYSALLEDVEALDATLESKYSKEILRLVASIATSFGIDTNANSKHDTNDDRRNKVQMEFVDRLARLARSSSNSTARDIEPIQGLSGATVLDYLVALIAVKSPSLKSHLNSTLNTIGNRSEPPLTCTPYTTTDSITLKADKKMSISTYM